jgi:hypothetical protein
MNGVIKGAKLGQRLAQQVGPRVASTVGPRPRATIASRLGQPVSALAARPPVRDQAKLALKETLTCVAKDFVKEARDDAIMQLTGRPVHTSTSIGGALFQAAKLGASALASEPAAAPSPPLPQAFLANLPRLPGAVLPTGGPSHLSSMARQPVPPKKVE